MSHQIINMYLKKTYNICNVLLVGRLLYKIRVIKSQSKTDTVYHAGVVADRSSGRRRKAAADGCTGHVAGCGGFHWKVSRRTPSAARWSLVGSAGRNRNACCGGGGVDSLDVRRSDEPAPRRWRVRLEVSWPRATNSVMYSPHWKQTQQ